MDVDGRDRRGRSGPGPHRGALFAVQLPRTRRLRQPRSVCYAQGVRRARGEDRELTSPEGIEHEKQLAAQAAAQLVEDGMTVGLGTGSTVAYLLPALAARGLELRCVATSPETMEAAVGLGLQVVPFTGLGAPVSLNLAIDGADQVAPSGWLVKGGGG